MVFPRKILVNENAQIFYINFRLETNIFILFVINLENVELLLDELDFHFDVIGISETKITNSNESKAHPNISGYVFEYVPTPLASGGIGLFVNQSLNYNVLRKTVFIRATAFSRFSCIQVCFSSSLKVAP